MKQPDAKVEQKLVDFFALAQKMQYKKGECILRADDAPSGVYYLQSGFVRQYIISQTGETFIIHIYKPGSFFPLTWIINDTPNTYYFDAMGDAVILRAQKGAFLTFLHENADVLMYATQKLAAGLHGLVTRVGQLVIDDAYTKTILLLLYYAENFGEVKQHKIELTVSLTHREVASWIGTTRETASLQMEILKNKGFLETKGRKVILPDISELQKEITIRKRV